MVELKSYKLDGTEAGKVSGEDRIFAASYSQALVHQALRCWRNAQRAGTHSTLTKGEVRGGGKKPWKQKGTGRARAGSIRSPLWRGGGVTFGPKPRDYSFAMPKKMVKAAIRTVISDRAKNDRIKIVDDFNFKEVKTKNMVKVLKSFDLLKKKTLIVMAKDDKNVVFSGRNIRGLKIVKVPELNIFDLLNCEWLVMEKEAVAGLAESLK